MTLIPALIDSGAGHVTMLQRSPTYIAGMPDKDPFAARVNKLLPEKAAYAAIRWKIIAQQHSAVPDRQEVPEVHAPRRCCTMA